MNDWQVGDLALCVEPKLGRYAVSCGFRVGGVYTVAGVAQSGTRIGLVFDGRYSRHQSGAWCASGFRKVRPDEHEACEPEFVTLLHKSKVTA